MKKVTFVALVVCLLAAANALQAQSVLKINILSPIVRTINVQYEQALNEESSFQLGFFYTGFSADETTWRGFGITPEYRFYLSQSAAPEGVFVAPFLRYQGIKIEDSDLEASGKLSAFGGGVIIGKQWVFKDKITLELFIGPAYYSGSVKDNDGATWILVHLMDLV
jgi:hypothetical protein